MARYQEIYESSVEDEAHDWFGSRVAIAPVRQFMTPLLRKYFPALDITNIEHRTYQKYIDPGPPPPPGTRRRYTILDRRIPAANIGRATAKMFPRGGT